MNSNNIVPLTETGLKEIIDKFSLAKREEDKMLDYLILNNSPFKLEEHKLIFQVSNEMQVSQFEYLKSPLASFIKKEAGILLSIEAEVQQAVDQSKKLYTSGDKFDYLSGLYPALLELKKKLGLELDM